MDDFGVDNVEELLGSATRAPPVGTDGAVFTGEHMLRFVVEVVSDLAFVPALAIVADRGRHFELFIGIFQLVTSLLYNTCDAMKVKLLLAAFQWHELANVMSITYGLFVIIYLMGNRNEKRDHLLRYCGFALVLVCQVKDGFWMQDSQYTVGVVVLFAVLYVMKLFVQVKTPPYNRPKLLRGVAAAAVAGVCFYLGLNDAFDEPFFRFFHGLSQVFAGISLYFLWQIIPRDHYKKDDDFNVLPHNNTRLSLH